MFLENKRNKNIILIVVAHSDDEALGMGGTISIHSSKGEKVYVISMTDGVGSRNNIKEEDAKRRNLYANKSAEILNFKWLSKGNFPDNKLDSISRLEIIQFIEKAKLLINPTLIYTHSPNDLNIDHRIVYESTITAFRPQPNEIWQEIRTFEVPSATDYGADLLGTSFNPNLFIDITTSISKKLKAIREYKEEIREEPHSRSISGIENLAKYRGNQIGVQFAEAFKIVKKILRY